MSQHIKPWEERLLENGGTGNDAYFKATEIAESRARIAELEAERNTMRQALEVIGVRDASDPAACAALALVEVGFWKATVATAAPAGADLPNDATRLRDWSIAEGVRNWYHRNYPEFMGRITEHPELHEIIAAAPPVQAAAVPAQPSQPVQGALTDGDIEKLWRQAMELPTPWSTMIAYKHFARAIEQHLRAAPQAPGEGLTEAVKRVLSLPRGTSGRIILELSDELELSNALATHTRAGEAERLDAERYRCACDEGTRITVDWSASKEEIDRSIDAAISAQKDSGKGEA